MAKKPTKHSDEAMDKKLIAKEMKKRGLKKGGSVSKKMSKKCK